MHIKRKQNLPSTQTFAEAVTPDASAGLQDDCFDPSDPTRKSVVEMIGFLYGTILVVWIIYAIVVFAFAKSKLVALVGAAFSIPLFLLWFNRHSILCTDEEEMIRTGTLSIGIVIVVSLLNHVTSSFTGSRPLMGALICVALLTLLISVPDFFFGHEYMSLTRHVRICFQTLAVGSVALAVALYYANRT